MATITPLSMIIVQEAMKMLRQTLHMCSFDDIRFTDGKVESQRVQLAKFMRPAGIRERIRTQIRRTPGHLPSPPRHCAPCRPPYRTFTSQRKRRNHKSVPCSSAHQAIFDLPPSKNNNDHFKTPSFNQSILHPDHFTQTHKSKACTRNSRFLATLLVTSKQRKVRRGRLHLSGEAD